MSSLNFKPTKYQRFKKKDKNAELKEKVSSDRINKNSFSSGQLQNQTLIYLIPKQMHKGKGFFQDYFTEDFLHAWWRVGIFS